MIGRQAIDDQQGSTHEPLGDFGAAPLYERHNAVYASTLEQDLHTSQKASEVNIFNMPVFFVVRQDAPPILQPYSERVHSRNALIPQGQQNRATFGNT